MKLLTSAIRKTLRANAAQEADHLPAVKLFAPTGAACWLLTELASDGDTLFGLADLGFGCPEIGYAGLSEIAAVHLPLGLRIERDILFEATHPLSVYAEAARMRGHITQQTAHLTRAAAALAARKARSPP